MIADTIENIGLYSGIPGLKKVVEYINTNDISSLPVGRTDIDGNDLYVTIDHPQLKEANTARAESHDRYADLQLIIEGSEIMGYAAKSDMGEPVEAHPDSDIYFYKEGGFSRILFRKGMFAIFFPNDAHAPCIKTPSCEKVKKAVFKIKMQ